MLDINDGINSAENYDHKVHYNIGNISQLLGFNITRSNDILICRALLRSRRRISWIV